MQFAPLDIPKPKKREDKPVTGLLSLFKLVAQDAVGQLADDMLEDVMDEIDLEAGDDGAGCGGDVDDVGAEPLLDDDFRGGGSRRRR